MITVVANNIPVVGGEVKLDESHGLPEEIAAIHIYRIEGLDENDWDNPYADFIPDCSPERIQQIIDGKNARVSNYRNDFQVLWLLIVALGTLSSTSRLTDDTLAFRYTSRFDRVFFFDMFTGRVEELRI